MKRDRTKTRKKLTLRERLTRRKTHRLAAHVSREDQWDYDVPNIRLSRAFVVVVVLHIVAVGGILVFEVLKPDGRGSASLADDPNAVVANDPRTLSNSIPEGVKIGDPRTEGLEPYIVRAGDTVKSIADKYGLSQGAIERQNSLDRGGRIYPGRHLFIPKSDDAGVTEAEISSVVAVASNGTGATTENLPVEQERPLQAAVSVPPVVEPAAREPVAPTPEVVSIPPVPKPTPKVAPKPAPEVEQKPAPPRFAVTETPKPTPKKPAAEAVRPVSGSGGGVHIMSRGDTPYGIARRYGVNVQQLLKANGISDPTNIPIGKRLKIPTRR